MALMHKYFLYFVVLILYDEVYSGDSDPKIQKIEDDIFLVYCEKDDRFLNGGSRFELSYPGNELDLADFGCTSGSRSACRSLEIPLDLVPVNLLTNVGDMVQVVQQGLRMYKCPAGKHFISYRPMIHSECLNGKQTPVLDYCVDDCPVATRCQDLPGMGVDSDDVDIPVFPFGQVNDFPKWIKCMSHTTTVLLQNGGKWKLERGISDYTWESNFKYLGTQMLGLYTRDEAGTGRASLSLRIYFKTNGILYHARYTGFKIDEDSTILEVGTYHGNAGDVLSGREGLKIESGARFWRNTEDIRFDQRSQWGPYKGVNMAIYFEPLTTTHPAHLCPPTISYDPQWDSTTTVDFPSKLSVGTKITYTCKSRYFKDQQGQISGEIECIGEEGESAKWSAPSQMPCKLVCPENFIMSEDGESCLYFSNDTAKDITDASRKCLERGAPLIFTKTSRDMIVLDAADTNSYYTAIDVKYEPDFFSTNDNYSIPLSSYTVDEPAPLQNGDRACSSMKLPNIVSITGCDVEQNYACRYPMECPPNFYNHLDQFCGSFGTTGQRNILEALKNCNDVNADLQYFESLDTLRIFVQRVQENLENVEFMVYPIANSRRIDESGSPDWTLGGRYAPDTDIMSMIDKDNAMPFRALNVTRDAFEFIAIDENFVNFSWEICKHHGYIGCLKDSPGVDNANITKTFNEQDDVGSTMEYECDHGFFLKGNFPEKKHSITCYGQLGFMSGDPIPCERTKVCSLPSPQFDGIVVTTSDDQSEYLDGMVKYACKTDMTMHNSLTVEEFKCTLDGSNGVYVSSNDSNRTEPQDCHVCGEILTLENAVEVPENSPYKIGHNITFECKEGYHSSFQNKTQSFFCSKEGWDKSNILQCYEACAGEPKQPGSNLKRTDFTDDKVGTELIYTCEDGQFLRPTRDLTDLTNTTKVKCESDYQWTYELPQQPLECVLVTRKDPKPPTENMTSTWDGFTRTIGSTVVYECDKDLQKLVYNMETSLTVVASEFGWIPIPEDTAFVCKTVCTTDPPEPMDNQEAETIQTNEDRMAGRTLNYTCLGNTYFQPTTVNTRQFVLLSVVYTGFLAILPYLLRHINQTVPIRQKLSFHRFYLKYIQRFIYPK